MGNSLKRQEAEYKAALEDLLAFSRDFNIYTNQDGEALKMLDNNLEELKKLFSEIKEKKELSELSPEELEKLLAGGDLLLKAYEEAKKQQAEYLEALAKSQEEERETGLDSLFTAPQLQARPLDNFIYGLTKGEQNLTAISKRPPEEKQTIYTGKRGDLTAPKVYFTLSYDLENKINGAPLTAYDRQIYSAICSIYAAGNSLFTPAIVLNCLNGGTNTNPSRASIENVRSSIEKLAAKRITIDAKEQARAKFKDKNIEECTFTGFLLPVESLRIKAGGIITDGYRIIQEPQLMAYSKHIKQLTTVNINILDTSDELKNTTEVQIIRGILIEWIEILKNSKNSMKNNKLSYETIYEKAEIIISSRQVEHKKRTIIKKILQSLKNKAYITDFNEYQKAGKAQGIEIFY